MDESRKRHIVVISGSTALDAGAVAAIPHTALVLSADGGLDHAKRPLHQERQLGISSADIKTHSAASLAQRV